MEYAFLAIAIVSEVIATSYLKQTEGFTKLTPSLICAAAYIVCHYTFAKSLNRINLNIGYATWCGVGLIVTSLVSIFAYKEKLSTVGIIGLVLITAGCVMVNAFGNKYSRFVRLCRPGRCSTNEWM